MGIVEQLNAVSPGSKALEFLGNRILSDNYRGIQLSQHNRYDVVFITKMLKIMYEEIGNNLMAIRTTDSKKRPYNTPDEFVYAKYVSRLASELDRCTQDSVRKNFFVDLHRMGFIRRFDSDKSPVLPYERSAIKYVSLSPLGLELVKNSDDIFQRNLIYTKAIDRLTFGLAQELLDVVSINDKLTMTEFMFFISFLNQNLNGHIYRKDELTDFVLEYRKLSFYQKQQILSYVEKYCTPSKFSGNKTLKRDYHNWKNETQQIFMLMDQTVFFELREETLVIRLGENSLYEDDNKLKRSIKEKENYFKNHNIKKKVGYELHHVIPLLLANNRNEFAALDVWENMVYIDGYTHSKITHTNNKNIELNFKHDDIELTDPANIIDAISCKEGQNVLYDPENKDAMKSFNSSILDNTEIIERNL